METLVTALCGLSLFGLSFVLFKCLSKTLGGDLYAVILTMIIQTIFVIGYCDVATKVMEML